MDAPQFRVAVAVPAHDYVRAMFAHDLARLTGYVGATALGTGQPLEALRLFLIDGTLIAPSRYGLVRAAQAARCSHLLFLDSDMRFPKDTLVRLLAHNKPIVAANYAGRRIPSGPVAFRHHPDGMSELVYTFPHSTGLEKIDAVGLGCCLIAMEVFAKVPVPWFPLQWRETADSWDMHGEDMGFCDWARKAGYEVWIDHDLSQEVRHIGAMEFTHDHAIIQMETLRSQGLYRLPEPEPAPLQLVTP